MQVDILCPDDTVASLEVESCTFPGAEGYLTVLEGHTRLVTQLGIGVVSLVGDGANKEFFVPGGFAEVLPDRLTIFANSAETTSGIDVDRAKESRERAVKRLQDSTGIDFKRAQNSLIRAEARLEFCLTANIL